MEKTNNVIVNNAVYGIFDNFENKLRMGFASKDIKKIAIEVAEEVVEKATVDGELVFGEFKDKVILFKDALEIFDAHGFTLAIVPNYMEALLKEGISTVVSTSSDAFFDGSNEGVKLLKFHYKSGAKVVVSYYNATDFDMTEKGFVDIPNISSEVTWEQAIEVMKDVQKKHQIDLFAPGYFNTCSCCAVPKDFPKKYFLNKEDANLDNSVDRFTRENGSKIKSIVLANAHNISGAPKFKNKKGPEVFGMLTEGLKAIHQYVYTRNVTTEETKLVLDDFVNGLNELVGEETYSLELPEEEGCAFAICIKQ
jgi:hypothetical protein